jgi:hypothetical protein
MSVSQKELDKLNQFIKYLIVLNMNNPSVDVLSFLTDAGKAFYNLGLEVRSKMQLPGVGSLKLKASPDYKVRDLVNSFNKENFYKGKDKSRQAERFRSKYWNYDKIKQKVDELKIDDETYTKIKDIDGIVNINTNPSLLQNVINNIPLTEILSPPQPEPEKLPEKLPEPEPQQPQIQTKPVISQDVVMKDMEDRLQKLKQQPQREEKEREEKVKPKSEGLPEPQKPPSKPEGLPEPEPVKSLFNTADTITNAIKSITNSILPELPKLTLRYGGKLLSSTPEKRLGFARDVKNYAVQAITGLGFTGNFIYNAIINGVFDYVINWARTTQKLTSEEEQEFIEVFENLPQAPVTGDLKHSRAGVNLEEDIDTEEFLNRIDQVLKGDLEGAGGETPSDAPSPGAMGRIKDIVKDTDPNIIKALISGGVLIGGYSLRQLLFPEKPKEEKQQVPPEGKYQGISQKALVINVTPDAEIIKPHPENEERYKKFIFTKSINDSDNPLQLMNELNQELRFFNTFLNRDLMKEAPFGERTRDKEHLIERIRGTPLNIVGDHDYTAFRHGLLGARFTTDPNDNLIDEFFDDQQLTPFMYDNFQQDIFN